MLGAYPKILVSKNILIPDTIVIKRNMPNISNLFFSKNSMVLNINPFIHAFRNKNYLNVTNFLLMADIRDWISISRAKMEVATIVNPLIGIFMAANNLNDLLNFSILVYIIIYLLIITMASELNCLCDLDVDRLYKKNLYFAVLSIGKRKIKIVVFSKIFLSLLLMTYLLYKGFIVTCLLALFGLLISIAYSAPPRLKAKGVGFLFLSIGIFVLPVIGGWFLLKDYFSINLSIFLIGYLLLNGGFILINIGEDYEEDLKENIRTIAHVIGLNNLPKVAFLSSFFGYLLLLYSILSMPYNLSYLFIFIFSLSVAISLYDLYIIMKVKNIKKYAYKVPFWFAITRYPLLLIFFIRFFNSHTIMHLL